MFRDVAVALDFGTNIWLDEQENEIYWSNNPKEKKRKEIGHIHFLVNLIQQSLVEIL